MADSMYSKEELEIMKSFRDDRLFGDGVYWVKYDNYNQVKTSQLHSLFHLSHLTPKQNAKLRATVESITDVIDLAITFCPMTRTPNLAAPNCFPFFVPDFAKYTDIDHQLSSAFDGFLISQVSIVHALHPFIKNATNPRVMFFCNQVGAISSCTHKMVFALRVSHAAVMMAIRALSLEFPHAIVVGCHMNQWFPSLRENELSNIIVSF
jgi:hypothetical protein